MLLCAATNCKNVAATSSLFCTSCFNILLKEKGDGIAKMRSMLVTPDMASGTIIVSAPVEESPNRRNQDPSMSTRYPKYYKSVPTGVVELDIYAVCSMFQVNDAALSHALKKIMLPGTRTGGKSRRDDIKEARDTLTRWLELNK